MGPYARVPELTITSPYVHSIESTPKHLPLATLCQSRPYPCARVDFIPQSGSSDLASAIATDQVDDNLAEWLDCLTANARVATVLRRNV